MGNKKKKAGSHRSHLKQQKLLAISQLNDYAILALAAPPPTIHATVTSNSNSKQRPPVASATVCSRLTHHALSSPHGPAPQYHGDPSINHIFVEDWSGNDDMEDKEVDFNFSEEDYVGASAFFTSPVVGASPAGGQLTPVASPVDAQSTPLPLPPAVGSISLPLEKTVMPSSHLSGCCVSPISDVAGAQSTPPPLPPAEKILSPPLEKSMTPSSLPPGCGESSPTTIAGKPFLLLVVINGGTFSPLDLLFLIPGCKTSLLIIYLKLVTSLLRTFSLLLMFGNIVLWVMFLVNALAMEP